MHYDAVIGPPVIHPNFSMQEIWIRYIFMQLGEKVLPKGWNTSATTCFRAYWLLSECLGSANPCCNHSVCPYQMPTPDILIHMRVRPSKMKYSREHGSLKPRL